MGASGSSNAPSSCKVRNRLGCPVKLLAARLPQQAGEDATAAVAGSVFQQSELAHGYEYDVQAAFHDAAGLLIGVLPDDETKKCTKTVQVPNGAVLLMRAFDKGEIAFRILQANVEGSEMAHEVLGVNATALWRIVVPPADASPEDKADGGQGADSILPAADGTSEPVVQVSAEPLCYATGSSTWVDADPECCDQEEELDGLFEDRASYSQEAMNHDVQGGGDALPDWTEQQQEMFDQLRNNLLVPAIRARKALEIGRCTDLEEAVEWLERHQDDDDIDVSSEELRAQEEQEVALAVLRVLAVPALHRLSCLRALHRVLGNILADPESTRLRQIRIQNPRFKERLGRFPQAVALLKKVGFKQGDFWTSAFDREPCLEWRLHVGSENPLSQRMERAYSLLDEVLRSPDDWLPAVCSAQPEVASELAGKLDADSAAEPSIPPSAARALLAEVHARRARDPRGFKDAMAAAGKANPSVYRLQQPVAAQATAARPLAERFPGRREFNLQDIEAMRVEEAIGGMPMYAREYEASLGQASTYRALVSRSYDPNFLGRRALDETNIFRASLKVPPLKWCQGIADIAAEHAGQMARGEMPFSHDGFSERVRRYPLPHLSAAENLAYNGGVADAAGAAVQGWIKSPGHRKNLLGAFDLCGIGVAQSSAGQFFFTQLFARSVGGALC